MWIYEHQWFQRKLLISALLFQELCLVAPVLYVISQIFSFFQVSDYQVSGGKGGCGYSLLVRVLSVDDGGVRFSGLIVYCIPDLQEPLLNIGR